MPINNSIINQKGTPAFYSDIFANRPAFGYAGRVFISTDTGQIFEDTGTSWTIIADAGAGTTGTLQQVTTNGNTTTLGIVVQGININKGTGTGANNIAIGSTALGLNSSGISNVGIGSGALANNSTANYNTAIGVSALNQNTTAGFNTAIGYNSLQANTTATNNTAVGYNSLLNNTIGVDNTAIGTNSLLSNSNGGSNTAIGMGTLFTNSTGSNNTAIGKNALNNNTTGEYNIAIGVNSLPANTTGIDNTAIGGQSLQLNTTGSLNTAIGFSSLQANTTGGNNTALGSNALLSNTTSSFNVAVGNDSLKLNTTGASNTSIGSSALQNNTTGGNNTAIGNISLQNNTTGTLNTAVGVQSLAANTTGTGNTAIGSTAGGSITTGSNNTILGNYTGTTTLASNIVLSDGAGNVRLFSDANGLIGINQAVGSTIGGQLDIHTAQTYALVLNGLTTSNAYTAFSNNSVGQWRIGNTYNAGANTFDIFNLGTSSSALSFNKTTNNATFIANVTASSLIKSGGTSAQILAANGSVITAGTNITISGGTIASSGGGGSITLSAIGSTPNANAATLTGSALNLEPASASFGGVVTTGTQTFAGAKQFNSGIFINATDNFTAQNGGFFFNGNGSYSNGIFAGTSGTQLTLTCSAELKFVCGGNANSGRFSSTGQFGLNTTTIGSQLQVNGNAAIGYSASTAAPTNGLAVSGITLVGTTSESSTNSSSMILRPGTGAYSGVIIINHSTTNNTSAGYIDCYYNTAYIGGIAQNGTSAVSFATSSDYRLKDDLKDFNGLELLSKIKTYDFKWKYDNSRMYGVVAHELQEIVPYLVNGNKDEYKENGKIKIQVVDYSKLVPIIIKSIQEQQQQIEELKQLILNK